MRPAALQIPAPAAGLGHGVVEVAPQRIDHHFVLRDSRVPMAQAVPDLLQVEALLQQPRGMGVAQGMRAARCRNGLCDLRSCWLTML